MSPYIASVNCNNSYRKSIYLSDLYLCLLSTWSHQQLSENQSFFLVTSLAPQKQDLYRYLTFPVDQWCNPWLFECLSVFYKSGSWGARMETKLLKVTWMRLIKCALLVFSCKVLGTLPQKIKHHGREWILTMRQMTHFLSFIDQLMRLHFWSCIHTF